jgi:hydrogenase nickel incorporation protein HypA/HybF
MHEGNFTQAIVDAILGELKKYPNAKPETVRVSVGEMLHLVPGSVQLHYDLMTRGTRLEGIKLELQEIPVTVRCRPCGYERAVEDHHLLMCAHCGALDVKLLSGDEILIDSIEFAESTVSFSSKRSESHGKS